VAFIFIGKNFNHQGRPYMDNPEIQTIGDINNGFGHPSGHSLNCACMYTIIYLELFYKSNGNKFKP
jgi:hypothetical protein